MNEDIKLIDFNAVVKTYSFKPWGLRHRIRKRQIPFVKIGRKIYFDPADLDRWVDSKKIKVLDNE